MTEPNADRIFAAAERDAEAGDWDAARAGYLRVLEVAPSHADAMLQLSYAGSLAGHYREAREWALRAAAADLPRRTEPMLELVRRLRTFNESEALHRFGEHLLGKPRTPPAVLVEVARQLSNLNDFGLALRCADAALRMAPGDPAARLVRGQLLAHHGRVEEATRDFERVLQRNPRIAQAWWLLSRLKTQSPGSNHVAQLQALLGSPALTPSDTAVAARALHKELDDLGDYEAAWRALETMCRARRGSIQYEREWTRALVDDLVAWSPGGPAPEPSDDGAAPIPVFIVGMHRSGTTLLEQLLDASPQVRGVGELNDFPAAMRYATDRSCRGALDRAIVARAEGVDFAEVGKRYMHGMAWRLGEERMFTDKQPANFLNIGFICRALPRAKILHLVRDPVETCFSNLRELFSDINAHSYDQRELADYFLQYRRLMSHWHATCPGRILDVPYSGLTADTEATMRAVAVYCGIEYVPEMSDPRSSGRAVATASGVQVRDRVVRREVPKWVPYARQLQPLVGALRDGGVEVAEPPVDGR